MGNLGVPEILIILLLLLVFFGAKKIPEMAQGLGKGIREFKKATREIENDVNKAVTAPDDTALAKSTCYYCKAEIQRGAKFCPSCGKSLESPTCPKCRTVNPLGTKFCGSCGEKLEA
jgi:sec-independent protein translocase protein TatA